MGGVCVLFGCVAGSKRNGLNFQSLYNPIIDLIIVPEAFKRTDHMARAPMMLGRVVLLRVI
jgi:hypothetical protein